MFIEIRETKKNGLIQITTLSERWYRRESDKKIFPSVTWISAYIPKGRGFEDYLKSVGDSADELLVLAGDRGNKIHQAIDLIVARKKNEGRGYIDIENETFPNHKGEHEKLNGDECEAVLSWVNWWKDLAEDYDIEMICAYTILQKKEKRFK